MISAATITEEIFPSLQGVVPSTFASCNAAGVPNVTYISQVYYVDERHVAISRQFFNKTIQNLAENPIACVILTDPLSGTLYRMIIRFIESLQSGDIYEQMAVQLQALTHVQASEYTFRLLAADLFEVISIEQL